MGALGEQSSSLLLSQAAKSAGVPCSPAQLYFLALEQVCLPLDLVLPVEPSVPVT